ncbi:MAG: hypothetical protein ISS74_00815 [Planctomycetes bacterium]|nr:hypothetical protein [Planctomycetota bacterium]
MAEPGSWQSKRWTVLASMAVLASLYMIMWYLTGGCERSPERSPGTGTVAPADPAFKAIQAMQDEAVADLSRHVAWFYAQRGRLPKDVAEMRETAPPDWPALPTATRTGRTITYRPTDPAQYDLVLAPPKGTSGAGPMVLPMKVPPGLPTQMTPPAFRAWWDIEHVRGMTDKLQEQIEGLLRPHGGSD